MTPEEAENYYDTHIAPRLMEIGKDCEGNGMSFVALCEWTPDYSGQTTVLAKGSSFAMRLTELAARAKGNVDTLIIALMKYARTHGHESICLHQLGVKTEKKQ